MSSKKIGKVGQWIKDKWFEIRMRLGRRFISKEEVIKSFTSAREAFFDEIPDVEMRDELKALYYSLDDLRRVTDLPNFAATTGRIAQQSQMIAAKYGDVLGEGTKQKLNYIGGLDSAGWRPSGARIFQGFINPFQIFSFYAENHWSTKSAIDAIVTEVMNDDFTIVPTEPGIPIDPIRQQEVKNTLAYLNIKNLRLTVLRHYLTYGNCLILPHRNPMFRNLLTKLELLIMDRCYPVQDRIYESIVGWDYWVGYNAIFYEKEKLYHLAAPSLKQPDIGIPPLASLVTDIESDLAASSLNGTIFHTAGMVGAILVMDDDPRITQGKNMEKWARTLQKEIQLQWSGVQGAHGLMVTNYVKAVHNLTKIGDLKASYLEWREVVAKSVCTVLRVPPEKLSINRSQGLQYQAALVEDSINKGFDKAISGYMTIVDNYINHILAEEAGITDMQIRANGRYGSMTLNGARMAKTAAETGALFTYDETREMFYGAPPLPEGDPRKNALVDNSSNRDPKKMPGQNAGDAPGIYAPGVRESAQGPAPQPGSGAPPPKKKSDDDDGLAGALVLSGR